jgi:golgi to ER traffic protein 4
VLTPHYRIEEGQFYEAHQQLRVIASRYVKQGNHDAAIDLLASGAQLLLKAGQGGSGGDLGLFLVEVYNKAEVKPDAGSKARILSLMRGFPAGEPTRKRFIGEAIT